MNYLTPSSQTFARRLATHRIKASRLGLMLMTIAALWLPASGIAQARTITLDHTDAKYIAFICPEVPQSGLAGAFSTTGVYTANILEMVPGRRMLMRYPLDKIPKGQRIVSAQWILPVSYAPYEGERLFVWRMLQSWGLGVNHTMRTQVPKPLPWSSPGADAPGIDRAITPTATIRVSGIEEIIVDVTQDVELWYTGVAPNNGWVMALDEGNRYVRLASPFYTAGSLFKLRITYEPE